MLRSMSIKKTPGFQVAKNSFLNFHSILKYLKNRVQVRVSKYLEKSNSLLNFTLFHYIF